ncbi:MULTISPECIES: hypothetical protein [unclassified Bradyrhizobium]|uniref:hypothetical protein n=1 Tax=unclassified Bradyrhizobium TaxID=2631580 RepID=UPI0028EAAAB0|nr:MULTISPECIES: hypothetical protein [unclassified Bradyrhizobium]
MTEIRADNEPPTHYAENGTSDSLGATAPYDSDAALIALGQQFSAISKELLTLERLHRDQAATQHSRQYLSGENACDEIAVSQVETILDRLDSIERAIMQTQACTIAGLGVKARHAAYVTSQYWEAPVEKIDWDARTVRLLIEAVCSVARTPLPFRTSSDEE